MSPLPHRRGAFTLIEMLVVMVVIAILAGIVLSIASLVQTKAARSRAQAEINALAGGCDGVFAVISATAVLIWACHVDGPFFSHVSRFQALGSTYGA